MDKLLQDQYNEMERFKQQADVVGYNTHKMVGWYTYWVPTALTHLPMAKSKSVHFIYHINHGFYLNIFGGNAHEANCRLYSGIFKKMRQENATLVISIIYNYCYYLYT